MPEMPKIKLGKEEIEMDKILFKIMSDMGDLVKNQNALNERVNNLTIIINKMTGVFDVVMEELNITLDKNGEIKKNKVVELEKSIVVK